MSLISVDCIAQIPLLVLPFRTSATQATFVLLQIDRSNNHAIVLHHVPTNLALVVQTLDSAIHRIKICSVYNAIGFPNTYPQDRDSD